eukprot:TRINITY_DN24048_c1_g1_i2.p1 TRINITY_DN24048_c1_g1~~TRINITY_DN24048_c1_g1_i2.p1  ORF type:complete len:572 (+),score=130.98 TRINITY_DN24048_c1_g1_i2:62-1777(+)
MGRHIVPTGGGGESPSPTDSSPGSPPPVAGQQHRRRHQDPAAAALCNADFRRPFQPPSGAARGIGALYSTLSAALGLARPLGVVRDFFRRRVTIPGDGGGALVQEALYWDGPQGAPAAEFRWGAGELSGAEGNPAEAGDVAVGAGARFAPACCPEAVVRAVAAALRELCQPPGCDDPTVSALVAALPSLASVLGRLALRRSFTVTDPELPRLDGATPVRLAGELNWGGIAEHYRPLHSALHNGVAGAKLHRMRVVVAESETPARFFEYEVCFTTARFSIRFWLCNATGYPLLWADEEGTAPRARQEAGAGADRAGQWAHPALNCGLAVSVIPVAQVLCGAAQVGLPPIHLSAALRYTAGPDGMIHFSGRGAGTGRHAAEQASFAQRVSAPVTYILGLNRALHLITGSMRFDAALSPHGGACPAPPHCALPAAPEALHELTGGTAAESSTGAAAAPAGTDPDWAPATHSVYLRLGSAFPAHGIAGFGLRLVWNRALDDELPACVLSLVSDLCGAVSADMRRMGGCPDARPAPPTPPAAAADAPPRSAEQQQGQGDSPDVFLSPLSPPERGSS